MHPIRHLYLKIICSLKHIFSWTITFCFSQSNSQPISKTDFEAKKLIIKRYKQIKLKNFRKTKILALDLDETLVHSSPHRLSRYNYTIEMYIDNVLCTFYVSERPHLHTFMKQVKTKCFDVDILNRCVNGIKL
jgi:TFIIF-interacting CTD phosphatase-like protein